MAKQNVLVTGGAGFIGTNVADFYLSKGHNVTILDNFSRTGTKLNADWLKDRHENLKIIKADVREFDKNLTDAVKDADIIFHLAGQVAVTTSVSTPREDFEINALGSFNVLEAARQSKRNPILINSSTNKVYGGMEQVKIELKGKRYGYKDLKNGITEITPLDFHSPYGCSKGCADQYFRDYSRIYGLRTVVFRQSCIYGYRQFGIEDQGWVAWFIIAALLGKEITIYGDGKQVRDVLFIEDLLAVYDLALKNIDKTKGKVYNI